METLLIEFLGYITNEISFLMGWLFHLSWWMLLGGAVGMFVFFYALNALCTFITIRFITPHTKPYVRYVQGGPKLLIAGDSTAVGTGASESDKTIGGYFAQDFPRVTVHNIAENGALTRALLTQFQRVDDECYDLIIISSGGNDIWALTPLPLLRRQLRDALTTAKKMTRGEIIVLFFGNEASAPFFPYLIRLVLIQRTDEVKELFIEVCREVGVPLIELFSDPKHNPFVKEPGRYFALDGLHPNDAGYWEWYKHLWRLLKERNCSFFEINGR